MCALLLLLHNDCEPTEESEIHSEQVKSSGVYIVYSNQAMFFFPIVFSLPVVGVVHLPVGIMSLPDTLLGHGIDKPEGMHTSKFNDGAILELKIYDIASENGVDLN